MLTDCDLPNVEALLERARAGGMEAFDEICRLYAARLLRQATALCGEVALAEDLAQETLIETWKCLARYNGQCQFFTWLCAILLHRHRKLLRKRRPVAFSLSRPADIAPGSGMEQWPDPGIRPDEAVESEERARVVRRCLEALPARHRQVIYLRFYVDDSLEGIAAALGCSVGTVKSRLFHGLEKLRRMRDFQAAADLKPRTDSL